MNVEKIAAIYELEDHEVKKILKTAGFDHKKTELTRDEMQVFDEVWTLVVKEKKTLKEAADIMKQRAEKSSTSTSIPPDLDPSFREVLDKQAKLIAKKYAHESPEVVKKHQELADQYLVQKFCENMIQMSESGELERNFDRVLWSDDPAVIEAQVLPGELSALPESSTSD